MTVRRREDDAHDDQGWQQREDPTELRLGFNGKSIRARGLSVIVLIVAAIVIALVWYITDRHEALAQQQHRRLSVENGRTSCLLTMDQAERARFREQYGPGAFSRVCPWVDE